MPRNPAEVIKLGKDLPRNPAEVKKLGEDLSRNPGEVISIKLGEDLQRNPAEGQPWDPMVIVIAWEYPEVGIPGSGNTRKWEYPEVGIPESGISGYGCCCGHRFDEDIILINLICYCLI